MCMFNMRRTIMRDQNFNIMSGRGDIFNTTNSVQKKCQKALMFSTNDQLDIDMIGYFIIGEGVEKIKIHHGHLGHLGLN